MASTAERATSAADASAVLADELVHALAAKGGVDALLTDPSAKPAGETLQIPLLSPAFCAQLVASAQGRESGTDGIHVTEEFRPELERVVGAVEAVLARGVPLEYAHAMIVHYPADAPGHEEHEDDSGLTINVALNDGYEGGELMLESSPSDPTLPATPFSQRSCCWPVAHRLGYGTLHDGARLHASRPCSGGPRYNLVVFASVPSATFHRFPDLQPHLQLLVLTFCSPRALGAAACTNRALAEAAARDEVWRPSLEFAFDDAVFRRRLARSEFASRRWLHVADAKSQFAALLERSRREEENSWMQTMRVKRIIAEPGDQCQTVYARRRGRELRGVSLLAPVDQPQLQQLDKAVPMVWGENAAAELRVDPLPAAQSPLAGPELLEAAVARSRGTAWRLVAWQPGKELVKYWVVRCGEWRGVYVDELRWVHEQLSSAPQVCAPVVEPPGCLREAGWRGVPDTGLPGLPGLPGLLGRMLGV